MSALGPDAPVWQTLSGVVETAIVADEPGGRIGPPREAGTRTVVIPLMEPHTRHCPRTYDTLIPDPRTVGIFADKCEFLSYIRANDLAHLCPVHFAMASEARFPCVVKRSDLNSGIGIAVAHDQEQLKAILKSPMWSGHGVLLQALTPGVTECVTHCVCKSGRIIWHKTFAYDLESPDAIRGPAHQYAIRSIPTDQAALSAFAAILQPCSYDGPCNIDYKLRESGAVSVFEVNPRMGGSLMKPENLPYLHEILACLLQNAERQPVSSRGLAAFIQAYTHWWTRTRSC